MDKKIQIILFTFLVLWTYTASAERNYCCQDKGPFINKTCRGGEKSWTKLNCPGGAYALQEYSFLEYDVLNYSNHLIEKERYCLGSFENDTDILAIVCFKQIEDIIETPYYLAVNICCGISIACLLLTTIVYILLPKLRDLQGKCIMITVINLLVSYIVLFIIQRPYAYTYTPCLIIAVTMYFGFLSAFFWINVVAINIWRTTVRPKFLSNSKYIFTYYNIYGWGIPVILLTIALICHHVPGNHIKPGWTEHTCWFQGYPQLIFFYIPILVVMSMNIVIFISVGWKIWRYERNNSTTEQSTNIRIHKSRKYKCILYLKLFLIMGITWIFEPMSTLFYDGGYYIWLLTDYVNALQGVIIFLVLVVFRKRVRRDLARRGGTICGKLPKDWALIPDEEMEELEDEMDEEEQVNEYNVQLNQPF